MRVAVRYRLLSKRTALGGAGATLNVASEGALFTTEGRLPQGRRVEIAIDWPARLNGLCPLQLIAIGPIVRSEQGRAAMRFEHYEFRTRALAASRFM